MSSYLLFHEYIEGTVALKSEYESLLQEHLGANKAIDLREQWALICGYSDEKMKWLQSVCDFPENLVQKEYSELFQLWFQLRFSVSNYNSPFSPFQSFVHTLALRESLNCPEEFYISAAEDQFNALCKHSLEVLSNFYIKKVDHSLFPCLVSWLADSGYSSFFTEYPILFRLLVDSFLSLIHNVKLILKRIEHDKSRIDECFGISRNTVLSALSSSGSDQHNCGQGVSILTFSDGKKLVYKPHSLETDLVWNTFAEQFNACSLDSPLRTLNVLNCGDYGYSEFIEYTPNLTDKQCDRYFERCGTLLSVLAVLGGSDFHYENLIISEGYPVLVDTETLITPWAKPLYSTDNGISSINQPSMSILRTLLLSKWVGKTADGAVNIGAFCSFGVTGQNLPYLNGNTIVTAADYIDAFLRGFKAANHILQQNKTSFIKLITNLTDVPIRFVLRNTRTYYELLNYFTNLRGLRDGSAYECVTSRVYAAFLLSCDSSTLIQMLPAIRSEQEALKRRDIPLFYSRGDSTNLFDSDGALLVTDFFELSPIDIVKRNLTAVNHILTEAETHYIRCTLHLHSFQNTPTQLSTWSYADCIRNIKPLEVENNVLDVWIKNAYDAIKRNTLDEKNFAFYAPKRNILNGRYELNILDNALYNGRYGILCYILLYADYKKDIPTLQNIGNFIQKQLDNLLERRNVNYLLNLSFTEGLAGLFLLIRNYCIVTHQRVVPQAYEVIRRITPAQIRSCSESDYFNGLSGLLYAICSLCSLSEKMGSNCADVISCLVDVILSRHGECGWFDAKMDYAPLTGIAHGQIGYSLALTSALPFVLDKSTIVPIIIEAINYERNAIDPHCFNLPDYRRFKVKLRESSPKQYMPRFMHGNCSGIIGSTAAILQIQELIEGCYPVILEALQCDVWLQNVKKYLDNTDLVGNDSLCCGTAAWLDLLNTIRQIPKYNDWANQKMWSIIMSLNDAGVVFNAFSDQIEDISLFKGITGIGYCALRIKGTYPSVLF